MRFTATSLSGVYRVEPELIEDERGFFARTFCAAAFVEAGLAFDDDASRPVQCSLAYNRRRGTLRGLHYRTSDHPEDKLVRCVRGAVYDVALDLRRWSPSFGRWHAEPLSAENRLALYLPSGVAHGYLTLEDDTELLYQMNAPHVEGATRGVRWDDPAFGVAWPASPDVISDRDATYPNYALAVPS